MSVKIDKVTLRKSIDIPHAGVDYVIALEDDVVKARDGKTGNVKYSGDIASVVSNVTSELTSGGSIKICPGVYMADYPVVINCDFLTIDGRGAIIEADSSISRLLDARNRRFLTICGLTLRGNGLASKLIDLSQSTSRSTINVLQNIRGSGGIGTNLDFTGSEDTLFYDCFFDGRTYEGASSPTTEYGILCGDGATGGAVWFINCRSGYNKYGDVRLKNIKRCHFIGGLPGATHKSIGNFSAPYLRANIIIDGSGSAYNCEVYLKDVWIEGGGSNVPSILIENGKIGYLVISDSNIINDGFINIYSTLNPAADYIHIKSSNLEHGAGSAYNIDLYASYAYIDETFLRNGGINKGKLTRYRQHGPMEEIVDEMLRLLVHGASANIVEIYPTDDANPTHAIFQIYLADATTPVMHIKKNGKVYINNEDFETNKAGGGIIVRTPDGTKRYRIRVNNDGSVATELVS